MCHRLHRYVLSLLVLQAEEKAKAQKAMETAHDIHQHRVQMVSCTSVRMYVHLCVCMYVRNSSVCVKFPCIHTHLLCLKSPSDK